ncbi:hypothetical protein BDV36DRAFT_259528 [Aspergillus pseudocaelatus]|uniref:Uncharacterized protein n=1 Tax=Aspergillus pseudocaelatus TaxID=1825620 RepID=A0ABQ6WHW8_9EURO|nr:hypothetical protein BDV36DRAFT_259528 [Aspergillus pseudocaelatus]
MIWGHCSQMMQQRQSSQSLDLLSIRSTVRVLQRHRKLNFSCVAVLVISATVAYFLLLFLVFFFFDLQGFPIVASEGLPGLLPSRLIVHG